LGRLISGVAHEINNPLSNISSSAQILLEDETTDPAWQRELLQQIDSETTRAQNIVRSLLDYARKRQSEQTAISLRPMVQETLRFLRADIPENVNIELDIPETLVVQGDKSHLQQAWFNLLRNAVESIENIGEVRVLAFALASGEAVIKIWDNGHGIATEVLPHVFEPFYSTRQDGAGMGLFIVKEIIDEHGGAISVESEPGKGTQFTVELPTGASQPENS
ncbi:MAG: GHKL domain-containing protein, partial [Betaproteobacteria bacterium]|nr:GHKL domain-containing protein [Betaproteobacteria bacterium]